MFLTYSKYLFCKLSGKCMQSVKCTSVVFVPYSFLFSWALLCC